MKAQAPAGPSRPAARHAASRFDPAEDAAVLLRRLGFFILVFAVPVAAIWARRATVILVPVGTALLVLAALLDRAATTRARTLRETLMSNGGACALLLLGWAALSIAWTPFPDTATEKIVNIVGTIAVALAGIVSLPLRMRAANLYLVPLGAGIAALAAIAVILLRLSTGLAVPSELDPLERAVAILAVMVWPGVAWLVSRSRPGSAAALVAVVALAAGMAGDRASIAALLVGAIVYGVVALGRQHGVRAIAIVLPAILAIAPLVPFLVRPFLKFFHGPLYPGAAALRIWADEVGRDPLRLITGHGLDTSLRARFIGLLPPDAPQTLPFEIWYELGLIGALAAAAALFFALSSSAALNKVLIPGVLAGYGSAFAIACLGTANAQAWWLSVIGAVVLTFVAIERGQFRTHRPGVQLLRVRRAAEPPADGPHGAPP
ncbi:peptide ABC transporter permease [Chelatococcus reniformis]|uniref:Peptide ABC transporter permease n=1 Tax=Chelatococcus reniformis TaxID=1494448 RepID=A0A916XJU3_9HYPH|nr:peptide ABC transporter permease [Chelatococcus reniformis]GGC79131.1 hypothetical protein GCM10010994_41580 [Chelatococcus reniformis]